MDANKIISYADTDYIIGAINEIEFVDRLRSIVSPSDTIVKCIATCDALLQCINAVSQENETKSCTVLEEMTLLVSKNEGEEIDQERDHKEADDLLLQRLIQLNETSLVKEYLKIKKWYA